MPGQDGDAFVSTPERDLIREQQERLEIPKRAEAKRRAQQEAQVAAEAKRIADEAAAIERRLRMHFVGTEAEWEAEKADLIRQERHRLSAEADRRTKMVNAATYQ